MNPLSGNRPILLVVGLGSIPADISSLCEEEGFSVIQRERGSDAIDYLLGLFPKPALVLFELDSPGDPSAVQFLRWKAGSALFDAIPLVLVSTRDDLRHEVQEYRAAAHLRVPFTRENLVGVLRRWVGAMMPDPSRE